MTRALDHTGGIWGGISTATQENIYGHFSVCWLAIFSTMMSMAPCVDRKNTEADNWRENDKGERLQWVDDVKAK